ncbi:MAG: FecR domain-containing protein [Elusimicrobia bacterium]|nr:FecR domain-containing protein [Elusimicrobiota bacterium]
MSVFFNRRRFALYKWLLAVSLAAASLFAPISALAATVVSAARGRVEFKESGERRWRRVRVPQTLSSGDQVRTGWVSSAEIRFDDGSKMVVGANGSFMLEKSESALQQVRMNLGKLRAWVRKRSARSFRVQTPTAVCAVRGTEFSVDVARGSGNTRVDLYNGLLAVSDNRGRELLLTPNQSVQVTPGGMSAPRRFSDMQRSLQTQTRQEMRQEVSLEMSKEEVLSAAAREMKMAEYQQGKTMIDVTGNRVRLEQYILRPKPDQFKLVVLNERADRFDYFYYLGQFNTTLPTDLSTALRQLPGCIAAACGYYLTGYETGRSNTQDGIREVALGGHQVDVNANLDSNDNVASLYDPKTDAFLNVSGQGVFKTLFDNYGFYINGKLKYGWTGSGITSYSDATPASTADPITGAVLTTALPTRSAPSLWSTTDMHQVILESYDDGTFTLWDNYIISDEGKIAKSSDFAGITSGAQFKSVLLKWNYEQVITASEFQGRKIDLVVAPKILIESGLIP